LSARHRIADRSRLLSLRKELVVVRGIDPCEAREQQFLEDRHRLRIGGCGKQGVALATSAWSGIGWAVAFFDVRLLQQSRRVRHMVEVTRMTDAEHSIQFTVWNACRL
jgi:hypothetical protein